MDQRSPQGPGRAGQILGSRGQCNEAAFQSVFIAFVLERIGEVLWHLTRESHRERTSGCMMYERIHVCMQARRLALVPAHPPGAGSELKLPPTPPSFLKEEGLGFRSLIVVCCSENHSTAKRQHPHL